jgi:hypothetical protein
MRPQMSKIKKTSEHNCCQRNNMVDDREYDQLDALTSSNNTETSRLSLIVKNLKDRVESLERNQTELMDKLNDLQKEIDTEDDDDTD